VIVLDILFRFLAFANDENNIWLIDYGVVLRQISVTDFNASHSYSDAKNYRCNSRIAELETRKFQARNEAKICFIS